MITLDQLNDHRRTYPAFVPDTIEARSAAIQGDLDALAAMTAPTAEELAAQAAAQEKAVADHDRVNGWLVDIKVTDPEQFEQVRRLPFTDLITMAQVK